MLFGFFVASIIYWMLLLVLFIWLNRQLAALKERIAFLEAKEDEKDED
jgi:hypothetical protein